MARSLNGNLVGTAARIANAEFREELEAGDDGGYGARYKRNRDDFVALRNELYTIDPDAQRWWENSELANILHFGNDVRVSFVLLAMAKRVAIILSEGIVRQVYHAARVTNIMQGGN